MMKIHKGGQSNAWEQQCATVHETAPAAKHWSYDKGATHQAKPKSVENSRDKRQDGTWARKEWVPTHRDAPSLDEARRMICAAAVLIPESKKVTIDKAQPDGSVDKIRIRIVMNEMHVVCYNSHFYFRKLKGRGTSVFDSRTPKVRRSLDFVRAELRRMLGATVGDRHFAELVG